MTFLRQILSDPALAYYYGQKAVRSAAWRDFLGEAVTLLKSKRTSGGDPRAAHVAAQLRDDGISFLPTLQIDQANLQQIRTHLDGKPLVDWYSGQTIERGILGDVPKNFVKLWHRQEDVAACGPLVCLANDPLVISAVTDILGAPPVIAAYQAWWTLGENQAFGPTHYDDVYHRDADDLRFVKLFAYLTDARITTGAHCFVKGSHRSHLLCRRGAISDAEVQAHFPSDQIVTIEGSAGTAFLENTWGIHRPLLATEGRRMIFSAIYTLTPWLPGRPRRPMLPLPQGLNASINRAFFYPV